jgi:hypothetical protein
MLGGLEEGTVLCAATNGTRVAEKAVSRLLARTESVAEAGPAEDRSGVTTSDQANVASESDLGLAPDGFGVKDAWHRCREVHS